MPVSGEAWLLIGCIAVGWWVAYRPGGGRVSTTGRMVSVRGHGHGATRTKIATHELGHAWAARELGGVVRSVTVTNSGGLVRATLPTSDPQAAVTFYAAGAAAAGTREGAHADEACIRRELRAVPRGQRKQVEKAGRRDAQRIARKHAREIERDAAVLAERGRL